MYFYNYKTFMLEYDIIIGPMFSGKSTELYRRINRFHSIGKRVLIVNHQNDTRTAGISTHDGREYSAIKCSHLMNLKDILNYDVIGIDEAQFFSDLYEFICNIEKTDKKVVVAGLDATSDRVPFGDYNILKTIPLCNSIVKLNALCMVSNDGTLASFTKRISDDQGEVCIGANDKYIAVCRKHFLTNT